MSAEAVRSRRMTRGSLQADIYQGELVYGQWNENWNFPRFTGAVPLPLFSYGLE